MNITIDIETIPGPTRPAIEDIKAPANYKDPDKIAAYQAAAVEDEWRKQALHPLKGSVLCIGYAVRDDEPSVVYDADEGRCVLSFANELYKALPDTVREYPLPSAVRWVGHNISEFDLVWLKLRAIKYGNIWLSSLINLDRYKGNYADTMQMMGSWRDKFSLADACEFFGLGCKADGMDGSKVFDLWQSGDIKEIMNYCREDVMLVRALYKRIS